MAFDQTTRNRLSKFVTDARSLLNDEFTRQLQHEYGLDPYTGEVTDLAKLGHLDDARRETATLLRETMGHYLAGSDGTGAKARKEVLDRIVREQAFTVLNRLCALRMAEARGLLIESVARGYQSKGFQLFGRLAGTALGETGHAYRAYLFSLFDEFAVDLPVLFDRFSPEGRLFPREVTLRELLAEINHTDIDALWGEDETIGWIYQYFNSKEERKAMRDASAAPRNSRELAVRNQFFTPRYVVEFLTDNTLGRIWYEMTRGETALKKECRYLVRRPNEVLLQHGEAAPESPEQKDLSQEELLLHPVYIPHRPLKDPRDLKMLDPACGSMHFGLYAFDLFEPIYEEAWEIEEARGADALLRSDGLEPLRDIYEDRDAFLRDVPRLIIERNVHGIDIDHRAVQIAGLSLWLRAQKSWQSQGVKPQQRPQIKRSNVVCAEPMPGEEELLDDFVSEHLSTTPEQRLLGQLFRGVVEAMKLAGEAGSLLRIEEEIAGAVREAKETWLSSPQFEDNRLFATGEESSMPNAVELEVTGITDENFWEAAEEQIYSSLRAYAESVANGDGGYQRRLFADDIARGFAFIDLCRKSYDLITMNPPFGEPSSRSTALLAAHYPSSKTDIDAVFVDRAVELTLPHGLVGGIYNRTQFFKGYLVEWRTRNLIADRQIAACVDLGLGVLDGAMVEAAAYVTCSRVDSLPSVFISALSSLDKEGAVTLALKSLPSIGNAGTVRVLQPSTFTSIPGHRISYWVSSRLLAAFSRHPCLEGTLGYARQGLITADNDRFLRLCWEIEPTAIARTLAETSQSATTSEKGSRQWVYYAKGGDYSPFYGDVHLVVNWAAEGNEIKNLFRRGALASRPQNLAFYFRRAVTYTERTASDISPRAMPDGCIFDCKGPVIAPVSESVQLLALLALTNTKVFKYFVELSLAGGDSSVSGSAARQFTQSIVGSVPVPAEFLERQTELLENSLLVWNILAGEDSKAEESRLFSIPPGYPVKPEAGINLRELAFAVDTARDRIYLDILSATAQIDESVNHIYGLDDEAIAEVEEVVGKHPNKLANGRFSELPPAEQARYLTEGIEANIAELVQAGHTSRAITKMSYFADRRIEMLAAAFSTKPSDIIAIKHELRAIEPLRLYDSADALLSYSLGAAFGRWDIRFATGEASPPLLPSPFEALPLCPPGQLQNEQGLPITSQDVVGLERNGRWDYGIEIPWDGILADDPGHRSDIETRVRQALHIIWHDRFESIEREACEILDVRTLRDHFRKPTGFFTDHLQRYSKSRRQAPIYWPLSTPSGTYALWLYYHRLTGQTLYTCVNDFLEPKTKQVAEESAGLRSKSSRSSAEERELERLSNLEAELKNFRDELLRIAKFWKPNQNDGVQITAAPLWRLFRHKPWQKKLKDTWERLEAGDYDWAHLAYSIWPDRVREKCRTDKSLAIAHGLEDLYEEPKAAPKKKRGRRK